jgi:hypothetical protein
LLCLYLAYRNLTDHDIEKLIIALVKKPLIAARIAKIDLSYNNLKKIPIIYKNDFPDLRACNIGNNPISKASTLTQIILNLRLGRSVQHINIDLTSSPTVKILDKYFINTLQQSILEAYRNLVALLSLFSAYQNTIDIFLKINTFLMHNADIFEHDINNLKTSLDKYNDTDGLIPILEKYQKERLPHLVKLYQQTLLQVQCDKIAKALIDLNSFINKNSFNAENLKMKNPQGYTPGYLAKKNMFLNFVGLRKDDEYDYRLINQALYNRNIL